MNWHGLASLALSLVLAPALLGVVNRTKAFFAGRMGAPLLQPYYDIFKMLRKGSVYSRSCGQVFRMAPSLSLAALACAAAIVPFAGAPSLSSFSCDMILFAYLLGVSRFFSVLAALDTASSFEGMGSSRELQFAALAEPAFMIAMASLALMAGDASLSGIYQKLDFGQWLSMAAPALLVSAALLVVLLAESCRVPFDDPNTHLELTMVHEVMVLDNGGPDLGMIVYASSLKLWLLGALLVMTLIPLRTGCFALDLAAFLACMALLGIFVGSIESFLARFRFIKIPQMLVGASALALLAMLLALGA